MEIFIMNCIIENDFYMYKNNYFKYNVKLDLDWLTYRPKNDSETENSEVKISIREIAGCSLMRSTKNEKKEVFLKICSYFLDGSDSKKKRRRKVAIFEISYDRSFEGNLQLANKWRSLIYYAMYFSRGSFPPLFKVKKNLLIFINPKSGPGIALKIFEERVKPMLSETEVEYDLCVTNHANHAFEIVQHKDLKTYAGIISIAGDGLIFEILNGLNQRSDREEALSIPIGVIPGGSGNAFANSIGRLNNEPYLSNPVLVSTLNVVNPVASPLDLIHIQTFKGMSSPLNLCHFILALPRCLTPSSFAERRREFSKNVILIRFKRVQNDLISFLSIGLGILADIDIDSEKLRAIGETRFTLYGIAKILRDFILIYATNMPYINSSNLFSPKSKLDDGVLWLCYVKDNYSRAFWLKFLMAMDNGTHVDLPGVTYIPVTGLRIVPLCSSGKITIDGELIEFGPLHATVLPQKGRYMVRRP
ncbi:Sphingosine kinase 1 [Armadillidium vulgare]|nr:Sphingosine kinase 1 [Armadillidium vulgare]